MFERISLRLIDASGNPPSSTASSSTASSSTASSSTASSSTSTTSTPASEEEADNSVTTTGSNGFTIEYTNTQYRVTQFENDHLYGLSLTFDGNPSSSGTVRLDDSNTNKWYDHSSDGRTGDLVKTWFYDTARTIPLATVSYTVEPAPTASSSTSSSSTSSSSTSSTSSSDSTSTPSTSNTSSPSTTTSSSPSTSSSSSTSTQSSPTETTTITVQTNRQTYVQGNPIVVFGKVSSLISDNSISLQIFRGNTLVSTENFKPTQTGDYTQLVIANGESWGISGEYVAKVSYDTNILAETSFNFTSNNIDTDSAPSTEESTPVVEPTDESNTDLKIALNKENFKVGDTIVIRTILDSVVSSENIAVTVSDPKGKNILSRTITVNNSDESNLQFKLVENSISGTYDVKITALINGQTFSDSAQFTTVSSSSGVKVISVEPTNQQGNTVSSFTKNKLGFVKVVLSAENPINSLVTVNLFDSEFTSLGVGSFKTQLSGNHEIILSFFIPEFTNLGSGEIYANVFSEWPSEGGIPLTGESSSQVTLK
jgi:hypothetical protein